MVFNNLMYLTFKQEGITSIKRANTAFLRNPPITNLCRGEKTGLSLRKRQMQRKKWPFSA
jgi:hypothetical protein